MPIPSPEEGRYRRRRARLVEELREKGIGDERILGAFERVPRHRFVDPALRQRAYADEALPIGMKQTISQPFTVAYQTMLLAPQPEERILEVGTGSGYQAAILRELGARVFSVERHEALLARTKKLLRTLGYRVVTHCGDGTRGWPAFAPYDGILVTAGAAEVPVPLLKQLRLPDEDAPAPDRSGEEAKGGRLVIPVGDAEGQQMLRITRTGPEEFEEKRTHTFRFVPLVGEGDENGAGE